MKKSDSGNIAAKNPLTVPQEIEDDQGYETSLRPKSLSEYIGQEKIKKNLSIFIEAAKQRRKPSIMCSSMVLPVSARRPWPTSWPGRWGWISR